MLSLMRKIPRFASSQVESQWMNMCEPNIGSAFNRDKNQTGIFNEDL